MEVKSNLRRAQSLRSVRDDHFLSWTEAGLRDRRKSVSQLVAQYQSTVSGKAKAADSVENKQRLTMQFTTIPVTEVETKLDTLVQNHESRERPRTRSSHGANSLRTRSKSMDVLPRQKSLGTSALRELYESKVAMQPKSGLQAENGLKDKSGKLTRKDQKPQNDQQCKRDQQPKSDQLSKNNQEPHKEPVPEDVVVNHKVGEESVMANGHEKVTPPPKEKSRSPKEMRTPRSDRRKTVTGVFTEKTSSQEDDKRKSVADFRDSFTLYGQEKSPISVKAISALYLSKVAAADPAGNLLKPEQDPPSPARSKVSKMADLAQKDSEQHENTNSNDDSAQPDLAFPITPSGSRIESQSPIPTPPSKEAISTLYQQRQKCELRRLLKHTCPELKGLGEIVDEELADILDSGKATDIAYGGEVQSRRWIFENGAVAVNTGESLHTQAHWTEKSPEGGHVFEQASNCLQEEGSVHGIEGSVETKEQTSHPELDVNLKECDALSQEENIRVDVKATRKMFEGQSKDVSNSNAEEAFPGRVVVSEEEKGAVQKQKRDFETYKNDSGKRTSPLNITDITNMGQDGDEVYLGISRSKGMFEKGSQGKECSLSANGNISTEDEILKTNVRNRAQMFESTPLDLINWKNEAELDTLEESMSKTLASLHNFNIVHSHGTLIEASDAAHVRKAKYSFMQDKGPEMQHEETVMGSMKSILLQILAKANLNSLIAFLKEDDQGNVEITNVDVPTHQLPFTVNQDKEYRTTIMVQVIEDLLGQETRLGKGVLIQECEMGSVETLVYALFRHEVHDGTGQTANCLFGSDMTKGQTSQPQLDMTPQKVCEALIEEEDFRVDVKATRKIFEGQLTNEMQENLEVVFPGRFVPEKENNALINRQGDDTPNVYTPPPPLQDDEPSSSGTDKNRTSNVKLFRSCIERGELDYLKDLQRSPSEEDLSVSSEEREQNVVIAPGNLKMIKALFANTDNAESSLQSDNINQKDIKKPYECNSKLTSTTEIEKPIAENENTEPGRFLHCQDSKYICNENTDKDILIQAELVDVGEDDELMNLQAAILSLQQATEEAKALHQSIQEKQQDTSKPTSQTFVSGSENKQLTDTLEEDIRESKVSQNPEFIHQQEEIEEAMKGSVQAALDALGKSSFNVTKGDFKAAMIYRNAGKIYAGQKNIIDVKSTDMIATSEENKTCLSSQVTLEAQHEGAKMCSCEGQPLNKPTACSPPTNQTHPKASLQSMIATSEENKTSLSSTSSGQVTLKAQHEGAETASCQRQPANKPAANPPPTNQTHPKTCPQIKKSLGPKPAIPPKPDHLKSNLNSNTVVNLECATSTGNIDKTQPNSISTKQYEQQCSDNETQQCKSPEKNAASEEKRDQMPGENQWNCLTNTQSLNEAAPGFQTALQNFGMKTGRATPPVKPKRIKMATSENPVFLQNISNDKNCKPSNDQHEDQPESIVTMRQKKVRKESEEERRQRLSVHMDEIMRGNASTAMEIFDQLRKQEELKSILSKVEEIEEDTSQKHASDLQKIFESVPDWIAPEQHLSSTRDVVEKKEERPEVACEREIMSSMQVAYGDLEKASAAIITLKEQTLTRLMDIEETIKKALYSVSTLKSDSDITGLSGLFKESMMAVNSTPISGNIRKISIGSSKSPKSQSGNHLDVPWKSFPGEPAIQAERLEPELCLPAPKPRSGSPSSPSFISIQSAARKSTEPPKPQSSPQNPSPKAETFQSTTCYNVTADRRLRCVTEEPSCSPASERRQVSTLEVQTVPEGEKIIGTKTIREKYEETDCFGNKFYSSKTSTVTTTEPETSFRRHITGNPATSVVTFPRVNIAPVKGDQPST